MFAFLGEDLLNHSHGAFQAQYKFNLKPGYTVNHLSGYLAFISITWFLTHMLNMCMKSVLIIDKPGFRSIQRWLDTPASLFQCAFQTMSNNADKDNQDTSYLIHLSNFICCNDQGKQLKLLLIFTDTLKNKLILLLWLIQKICQMSYQNSSVSDDVVTHH